MDIFDTSMSCQNQHQIIRKRTKYINIVYVGYMEIDSKYIY